MENGSNTRIIFMLLFTSRLFRTVNVFLTLGWLISASYAQSTQAAQQAKARRCLPIVNLAAERWRGEYFDNREFNGNPVLIRDDGAADLNFNWGLGSPDAECGMPTDNFAARWTRTIAVTADENHQAALVDPPEYPPSRILYHCRGARKSPGRISH